MTFQLNIYNIFHFQNFCFTQNLFFFFFKYIVVLHMFTSLLKIKIQIKLHALQVTQASKVHVWVCIKHSMHTCEFVLLSSCSKSFVHNIYENNHDLNVISCNNLALKVNGSDKYLPQNLVLLWELKNGTMHLGLFSTQLHILIIKTKGRQFIHDKCTCSDSVVLLHCNGSCSSDIAQLQNMACVICLIAFVVVFYSSVCKGWTGV